MSAAENKAVFLSYASQDAEAARRICEALPPSPSLARSDEARNELRGIESEVAARPRSLNRITQRAVIARIHAELGDVAAALPYVREILLEPAITAYSPKSFAMDPDWDGFAMIRACRPFSGRWAGYP